MSNTIYVLRATVLALASSVLVFLGVGSILANSWKVTTTRTIPASPARIAAKLVDLREWPVWSEVDFELGNPTTRKFEGVAGAPEQTATWRGPMGIATVLLTRIEDGDDAGVVAVSELDRKTSNGDRRATVFSPYYCLIIQYVSRAP